MSQVLHTTVIGQIYKNVQLAYLLCDQMIATLNNNTNIDGFIVCNSVTPQVKDIILQSKLPYIDLVYNVHKTRPGDRLYWGLNAGANHAKGDNLIYLLSDNYISKQCSDWVNRLQSLWYEDPDIHKCIYPCAQLVEPGTRGNPYIDVYDCGRGFDNFDQQKFEDFVVQNRSAEFRKGTSTALMLLPTKKLVASGGFKDWDGSHTAPDERMYFKTLVLADNGAENSPWVTSRDVWAYHFMAQESGPGVWRPGP